MTPKTITWLVIIIFILIAAYQFYKEKKKNEHSRS